MLSLTGVNCVDIWSAGRSGGCDIGATGRSNKGGVEGYKTRRVIIWGKLGC